MNIDFLISDSRCVVPGLSGNMRRANASETTTTDNMPATDQSRSVDKQARSFAPEFDKKTTNKTNQKDSNNDIKPQKRNPASDLPEEESSAQCQSAQESTFTTVAPSSRGTKTQRNRGTNPALSEVEGAMAETTNKSSQLIADTATGKLCIVPTTALKSATAKSGKLIVLTEGAERNPAQLTISQSQTDPKPVLPDISKRLIATGAADENGKQAGKTSILDKTAVDTNVVGSRKVGKKLMPQAILGSGDKTTSVDKKSATADKPAVTDVLKAPVLQNVAPVKPVRAHDMGAGARKNGDAMDFSSSSPDAATQSGKGRTGDLSVESIAGKLNTAQAKISADQTKGGSSSASGNRSDSSPGQFGQTVSAVSFHNSQPSITETLSDVSTKGANDAPTSDISADIGKQIQESIYSSLRQGDEQITVRLNPPELGKVFIKFQRTENEITGLLEVSKLETKYEIERVLPQIIRTLADSGVQIKRLELTLTNQPEQQGYKDQPLQHGPSQHRGTAEGGNQDNNSADQWLTDNNLYKDNPGLQLQISDGFINMLV